MKFKEFLNYIYIFSISSFWILFFIYFRFILERKTYTLNDVKINITIPMLLLTFFICCFHITLLLISVYTILSKRTLNQEKSLNIPVITKIKLYCQKIQTIFFFKPLIELRNIVAPHIPYSGILFCKFTTIFEVKSDLILKIIVILFNNMPRFIVSLIFFVETIFYNHIYYFIQSLFILFIPLCWNILLNLYANFAERTLKDISKNIEVVPLGKILSNGWHTEYGFNPFPQFTYEENEIKEYKELWFLCMTMSSLGETMRIYQKVIMPYMTIITSSLYLSAGIFRLIFVLF